MAIQDNWRWCNKCQAMCFAGSAALGACPAGGQHDHGGSGDYALVDNDTNVPGQDNWRWCNKCQVLSFAGNATLGACAAGGLHNHSGSGNYVLSQTQNGTLGQDNWRWCNKCQELTFAGSPSLGACPAGGLHAHNGSGDYVMAQVTDCSPLLQQANALQKEILGIQSAPGYIQGPNDPQPGKPDPELLAEVKALQLQHTAKTGAYDTCEAAMNDILDVVCDETRCVSIKAVYANIAARLNGKVVGYSCSVGRSLTYQSFGHARTSANAPAQSFLSSTKIPVASVSKVVTALAAISVLGKHGVSLDAPIGSHLPNDWVLDPNVAAITFRQLLSHRSGIKDYGNVSQDYAALKKFFTQKVDPTKNSSCTGAAVINPPDPINPNNKSPCYSNYNFAIFRVLLPMIDGFTDDPVHRAENMAAAYVKIAQTHVFEPVGAVGVDAKPPTNGPQATAYAFSYKFPGTSAGVDWKDDTLIVGAAGWYLAVEDIAKVLASLNKNDGRILTPAQLQDMETTPLGWDTLTDAAGYRWIEKNGGWGADNTAISTSIALFGPGVLGVLFINSDISGEPNVGAATVLHDAYMSALTPRP
ncbi:MAG TPA: serine hydrolase domain-containing protein [Aliidongia sp.]|nr:serine hydrolase domain-containing protein [Aliidongia sp.]